MRPIRILAKIGQGPQRLASAHQRHHHRPPSPHREYAIHAALQSSPARAQGTWKPGWHPVSASIVTRPEKFSFSPHPAAVKACQRLLQKGRAPQWRRALETDAQAGSGRAMRPAMPLDGWVDGSPRGSRQGVLHHYRLGSYCVPRRPGPVPAELRSRTRAVWTGSIKMALVAALGCARFSPALVPVSLLRFRPCNRHFTRLSYPSPACFRLPPDYTNLRCPGLACHPTDRTQCSLRDTTDHVRRVYLPPSAVPGAATNAPV
jgi:hypothetical protein